MSADNPTTAAKTSKPKADRGVKGAAPLPANADRVRAIDNAGYAARDCAVSGLYSVFVEKRAFDDAFNKAAEARHLEPRDRAFARLVATTVLRHRGSLNAVISAFLQKPLPENRGRLEPILLAAAAQLLFLDTPPHAAISLAVDQCRGDSAAKRFDKLANAVLRRVATEGAAVLTTVDQVMQDIPEWLLQRWTKTYGDDTGRRIAEASLREASLDLSVKSDAQGWAERFGGVALQSGSVRLHGAGRIEALPGYDDGEWWVQDAAAALPAKLFGDLCGRDVADVCAAPGGKTAQLAMLGGRVTAIDKSPGRLKRLHGNLRRLSLDAETMVADAAALNSARTFDAILIDAPCTATGTIRRHPDILHLKRPEDVTALAALQTVILSAVADLVRPGGTLIYCTCSLEPEEGPVQINAFLRDNPAFTRQPIRREELSQAAEASDWLTGEGDLRTLPFHMETTSALGATPDANAAANDQSGCDGFYAARLVRAR